MSYIYIYSYDLSDGSVSGFQEVKTSGKWKTAAEMFLDFQACHWVARRSSQRRQVDKISKMSAFSKSSTAKDIVDGLGGPGVLAGKTAIVTGGNSGIGTETVKALAYAGARVILASRSIENGTNAIREKIEAFGEDDSPYTLSAEEVSRIVVKELDLGSLPSIKAFAEDVLATEARIDYIVLNAGVMAVATTEYTAAGFETQIGINHFGHFYLVNLLLPKLVQH